MTVLKTLPGVYGIYKFSNPTAALQSTRIPEPSTESFWALSYSSTETSLICAIGALATEPVAQQESWVGIYFDGQLDFQLVGVLSRLTSVLADSGLGILAISTFDTDYVFVPSEKFDIADQAITANGYTLVRSDQ